MIFDDKNKGMCQNNSTKTSNTKKSPTPALYSLPPLSDG